MAGEAAMSCDIIPPYDITFDNVLEYASMCKKLALWIEIEETKINSNTKSNF